MATVGASNDSECPICMGPVQRAVVSRCCRHRFCNNCIAAVQQTAGQGGASGRCPYCRSERFAFDSVREPPPQLPPQQPIRRPPPQASARIHRCQAAQCRFTGTENDFLDHLVNRHRRELLENHHLLFSQQQPPQQYEDPPERDPRLAENGKTYCGGPLNGPPCDCCSGVCGPQDGCNCVHCMTIDLANFQVTHGNSLVNKFGRVASLSSENGHFYCAAIMGLAELGGSGDSIAYCGPIDGPNCEACQALDVQCGSRYASLM
uniref:RING-type domain-containing protein n=1 Tax=Macrostomum lignano TaxID=282301 RepID=A0A1I8HTE7_9PLAT